MSSRPACTTRRGDARGRSFGTAGAVTTSASDRGSIRTPVSNASRPRQSDRKRGIAKNIPIITRYCMSSTDSPTLSWRLANNEGLTSGEAPLAARWRCQATKASSTSSPPTTSQVTAEMPSSEGVASGPSATRGRTQPQLPD